MDFSNRPLALLINNVSVSGIFEFDKGVKPTGLVIRPRSRGQAPLQILPNVF